MAEPKYTLLPWKWDGDDLWHFGIGYDDPVDPHLFTGITIDDRLRESETLKANQALIISIPTLAAEVETLKTDNARLRGRVNICIDLVQKMLDGDTFTKGFLTELRAALKTERTE